ncbi:MAG: hypothetical protein WC959_08255 [Kiritimatiellales bacterium]
MNYTKCMMPILLTAAALNAASFTNNPVADARVTSTGGSGVGNGIYDETSLNITVGDAANNKNISAGVFIYKLPDLPAENKAGSISATWYYRTLYNSPPNLKICVFFKNTGEIEKEDYQAPADAIKLDFLTPTSASAQLYSWENDAALTAAVNSAYENGMSHIVFRLQLQDMEEGNQDPNIDGYQFASVDATTASIRPSLVIGTVPKPALKLFLIGNL